MNRFFDQYDAFFQTSQTSPFPDRLNARHRAIIEANPEAFTGKRVLDIASHDGRWSFAALKAGANHVVGVEARSALIDNARANLARYGCAAGSYDFLQGDVFDVLQGSVGEIDTVMCLGFFYHTIRHCEFVGLLAATGARTLIIDTEVAPVATATAPIPSYSVDPRRPIDSSLVIQLIKDPVHEEQMAIEDSLTRGGSTLVGRPSRGAVAFMADHFGYSTEEFDWPAHFKDWPGDAASMLDYAEGWRTTFICHLR
ncbi:methyltransferase domain-containing protein [Niveibacterium umoris]|uniref:SAM-dependent methyltransferase n=1 Tax=Niveibacterium umoris TaxID=1193620 RepID=A0A840BP50_9RHOO|nr:methyltransferase domain-containing protein [Niveibacterium umoris]MBB4012227.1 SAM-dependent methyltransferase [Niveibacterium umoris]